MKVYWGEKRMCDLYNDYARVFFVLQVLICGFWIALQLESVVRGLIVMLSSVRKRDLTASR